MMERELQDVAGEDVAARGRFSVHLHLTSRVSRGRSRSCVCLSLSSDRCGETHGSPDWAVCVSDGCQGVQDKNSNDVILTIFRLRRWMCGCGCG